MVHESPGQDFHSAWKIAIDFKLNNNNGVFRTEVIDMVFRQSEALFLSPNLAAKRTEFRL